MWLLPAWIVGAALDRVGKVRIIRRTLLGSLNHISCAMACRWKSIGVATKYYTTDLAVFFNPVVEIVAAYYVRLLLISGQVYRRGKPFGECKLLLDFELVCKVHAVDNIRLEYLHCLANFCSGLQIQSDCVLAGSLEMFLSCIEEILILNRDNTRVLERHTDPLYLLAGRTRCNHILSICCRL